MQAPAVPVSVRALSFAGRLRSVTEQLTVAQRLSGRLEDQPYRNADGMVMQINRADAFEVAMLTGLFDRHTAWMFRKHVRPASTVIDVGAHIGYFTMLAARLVGPTGSVHSFEPDPRVRPRTDGHVRANSLDWVTVNEMALLDRDGEVSLSLYDQLGWTQVGSADGDVSARATTLDAYVESQRIDPAAISLVKIDAEGVEAAVIDGGRSTLAAAHAAAVLVEHPPERAEDPDQVPSLMADLGFSPFVPVRRGLGFRLEPGAVPRVGMDVIFLRRGDGASA